MEWLDAVMTIAVTTIPPLLGYVGLKQRSAVSTQMAQVEALSQLTAAMTASTATSGECVRVITEQNLSLHEVCTQLGVLWSDRKSGEEVLTGIDKCVDALTLAQGIGNERLATLFTAIGETNKRIDDTLRRN